MTQDNKLVKKYDAIWNKDSNLIKKSLIVYQRILMNI